MTATMRRSLLVAVLAVVAAACTAGDDTGALSTAVTTTAPSTTSTSEATTTSTVACAADDADPSGLEPLVLDDIEGFQLRGPSVGGTGPSDLRKAVVDDGDPDARQVLTQLRFRRGYQRLWSTEFGDEVVLFLYEFCDEAGPTAYGERTRGLVARSGVEPQTFRHRRGSVRVHHRRRRSRGGLRQRGLRPPPRPRHRLRPRGHGPDRRGDAAPST